MPMEVTPRYIMTKVRTLLAIVMSIYAAFSAVCVSGSDAQSEIRSKMQLDQATHVLNKSLQSRQFKLLRKLVGRHENVAWSPCGGHDVGAEILSLKMLESILVDNAQDAHIVMNVVPELETPSRHDVVQTAVVETKNWGGTWRYVRFFFDLEQQPMHWVLVSACYSPTPALSMSDDNVLGHNIEYIDRRIRRFVAVNRCHEAESFLREIENKFPDLSSSRYDHIYDPWLLLVAKCKNNTIDNKDGG